MAINLKSISPLLKKLYKDKESNKAASNSYKNKRKFQKIRAALKKK